MNQLAQTTANRLSRAITAAPAAVGELMHRYDCEVPASPEALALLGEVHGDVFTDDLFILLGQVDRAGQARYARATGTGTGTTAATSQQRSALGRGLKSIVDFLRGQVTVSVSGSAGGVDYDATSNNGNDSGEPAPRIMGLSQPVFVVGVVMLLLVVVFLLVRHHKAKA